MSYSRRGVAYQYEDSPEAQANKAVRFQQRVASTMQRGDQRAGRIAALTALAKGIPDNVLPTGGIHEGMSPQDVQTATDRINRYRAEQAKQPPPTAPQPVPAPMPPTGASGSVTRNSDGSVPSQPAAAPVVGDRRTNPQGGHEQLMDSPTGPRWVPFVANPPGTGNTGTVTNGPTPFDYRGNRQFTNTQGERAYEYDPSKDTAMRQRPGIVPGTAEVGSNNKGSYGVGSVRFVHDERSNVDTAGNPIKAAPVVAQAAPVAPAKPPVVAAATPIAAPTVAPQVPPPVVNTTPPAAVPPVTAAYAAGQAVRAVPGQVANAAGAAINVAGNAVNKVQDKAMDAAGAVVTAGSQFLKGVTGAPPPVAAAPSAPTPPVPQPSPQQAFTQATGQPVASKTPQQLGIVPDDEEERKRRMASAGTRPAYQF